MRCAIRRRHLTSFVWLSLTTMMTSACLAEMIVSDGSDGPFNPVGPSYTLDLPPDGIFNFTTIDIPAGVMVKFNRNAGNTPVYLAATGEVTINGILNVSATATNAIVDVPENPKQSGGPGGGDGGNGAPGTPEALGEDGQGPGAGSRGFSAGGAGNATPGAMATRYGGAPGAAGGAVPFPDPFAGGSGGGGGDAGDLFGVGLAGGYGGGGGGAIQVATPGQMTVGGSILANGANAGWAFANVLAHGGAGGGGSGGCVDLYAGALTLEPDGFLQAAGGYGGGLSTQPYSFDPPAYSSGADGGLGYVRIDAGTVDLVGTIDGVLIVVPLPSTLCLLAAGAMTVVVPLWRRSRRR
jgi:hypothetical protein